MPSFRRLKVLVVDDDPLVLEIVRDRLVRAGHHVIIRDSALGTTQHVALELPDVVLLDVNMPAISGIELAQLIKKKKAGQSAILILYTSLDEAELVSLVGRAEAARTLRKSMSEREFLQNFERLTARATPG
jgi:DNA-binding response OmpR family regulator